MRPRYETAYDMADERGVAERLSVLWSCDLRKMPEFYPCDWAFVRSQKVVGLAEGKCRKVMSSAYPTLILSLHKWTDLQRYAQHTPTLLVARFNDCIKWIPVDGKPREVGIGGRKDRGDWQDTEPVVHIPIKEMKTA